MFSADHDASPVKAWMSSQSAPCGYTVIKALCAVQPPSAAARGYSTPRAGPSPTGGHGARRRPRRADLGGAQGELASGRAQDEGPGRALRRKYADPVRRGGDKCRGLSSWTANTQARKVRTMESAEVCKIITPLGVDVLDVHRLTHHALRGLTILTPVFCALMHPANRLRPGQLTHRWVAAHQG